MSDYGVKDIKTLEGIEAIRLHQSINNYLSRIYKYENCECKNGDKCNEPICIYSVLTLGNEVSLFSCGR